jgi:hypothetical protein
MRYLIGGLAAATLVGLSSVLVYGPGSQLQHSWIEPLFWALIASGALMSLFEHTVRCKLCALRDRISGGSGSCSEAACLAG